MECVLAWSRQSPDCYEEFFGFKHHQPLIVVFFVVSNSLDETVLIFWNLGSEAPALLIWIRVLDSS